MLGPSFTFFCTVVLASTGYVLYLLKTWSLKIYAGGELLFAGTSCYVAVERSVGALNIPTLTVLGGATYLVVRGLEN